MIVTCGEGLIDFVPAETADGDSAYVPRPGGSPFNTAITIGRLGTPAGFLTSLSNDFFGARIVEALRRSNVDTSYVTRLDRPTTLAFVNLETAEPEYAFYDNDASPRFWAPDIALGDDVTVLHLAFGALLPVDEPAGTNFAQLFARNKGRRILTLDPNVRQSVIRGRDEPYRARLRELLALADVVKISAADLAWLDPGVEPDAAAQAWLAAGASLVVITAGGDGSTTYTRRGERVHCPAQPITLVDTVGAGDSFMGGFLAGLDRWSIKAPSQLADIDAAALEDIAAFATRVSAITCGRAGADPPWQNEVALPTGAPH